MAQSVTSTVLRPTPNSAPAPSSERVAAAASPTLQSSTQADLPAPRSPDRPSLNFHSIVDMPVDSAGKAWSASCWKAATIGVSVLFGIIACTGFVLASLYAPGVVPFVIIAILFFMISDSLGVSNISNWCMRNHDEYEKKQQEDLFVEMRLKEWGELTYDQVVQAHDELLRNPLIGTSVANLLNATLPEGGTQEDRDRLKPLFARFLYFVEECQKMDQCIEEDELQLKNLRDQRDDILAEMVRGDFDSNLTTLNKEYRQREQEIADITRLLRLNDRLESSAYFHQCAAVRLYLLIHPINHVDPTISSLTWETLILPPLPVPEEMRITRRFEDLPSRRLPDGTSLNIATTRAMPVAELSEYIHRSVEEYLVRAGRRAAEAATAAAAAQPA